MNIDCIEDSYKFGIRNNIKKEILEKVCEETWGKLENIFLEELEFRI